MDFNDAEFSRWEVCDCDEDAGPIGSTEFIPNCAALSSKPPAKHSTKTLQPIARRSSVKGYSATGIALVMEPDTTDSLVSCLKQLVETKSVSSLEKISLELSGTSKEARHPTAAIPAAEFDWASPTTLESAAPLQPKDHTLPATQALHGHRQANRKTTQRRELRSLAVISCRSTVPEEPNTESSGTTRGFLPNLVDGDESVDEHIQKQHTSPLRSSRALGALSQKTWAHPDEGHRQSPLRSSSLLPKDTLLTPRSTKRTVSSHMKAGDLKLTAFRRLSDATEALRSTRAKRFDSKYALPSPSQRSSNETTPIEELVIAASVS